MGDLGRVRVGDGGGRVGGVEVIVLQTILFCNHPPPHTYTDFPETLELPSPKNKAISVQAPSHSHTELWPLCVLVSLSSLGNHRGLQDTVGEGGWHALESPFRQLPAPSRKREAGWGP